MLKKDKTLKGIKTPSRRKFFKAAAATGAVTAATAGMKTRVLLSVPSFFRCYAFIFGARTIFGQRASHRPLAPTSIFQRRFDRLGCLDRSRCSKNERKF